MPFILYKSFLFVSFVLCRIIYSFSQCFSSFMMMMMMMNPQFFLKHIFSTYACNIKSFLSDIASLFVFYCKAVCTLYVDLICSDSPLHLHNLSVGPFTSFYDY